MGFDNIKCNKEVFSEINSREQDPIKKKSGLRKMELWKNGQKINFKRLDFIQS